MSEFNFNSQVCTDKNQSERLLALGLKPETADCMIIIKSNYVKHQPRVVFDYDNVLANTSGFEVIPAWSLHRLIEMVQGVCSRITMFDSWIRIENRCMPYVDYPCDSFDNTYDNLIDCIEWLIKKRCFNKEYLV